MDFSFSSEQTLLQDSVERFIQNDYGFDQRQKLTATELGFSREHWAHFAELGWLGLPFAEEDGGFGGTAIDTMILMEAFGKGLVVEPYVSTVLMAQCPSSSRYPRPERNPSGCDHCGRMSCKPCLH